MTAREKVLAKWLPIPGFEGLYEVSEDGHVRSLRMSHPFKGVIDRTFPMVLSEKVDRVGRHSVTLCKRGKRFDMRISVAVLLAFHGPRPAGYDGAHKDGNPHNNQSNNLEWKTSLENQRDKRTHGTMAIGSRQAASKLVEEQVADLRRRRILGVSYSALAAEFGVSKSVVAGICRGESWKHVAARRIEEEDEHTGA